MRFNQTSKQDNQKILNPLCRARKPGTGAHQCAITLIAIALPLILSQPVPAQTFPNKYHTYAEALSELDSLAVGHPTICRLDSIGHSDRDSLVIYALKISDNVAIDEDEPAVFICAGVHADEILGPEVALGFARDIVQKYALGDSAITRYVHNLEIFVVPFINPEGHVVVEQGNLTWRKNKCDNDSNGIFDYHDGVDNNRNYDFGWSIDTDPAATTPESLMYKGTAPFTQAENRAIAAFGWKYRPLVALDYHSPTYGRSEVAYYPWYWYPSQGGHGMSPDEALMRDICREYCSRIINDAGDSCYEARRALVDKGDFKTYFYGNFGTAAFAVEISDTTIQDTMLVDGIVARHLPGEYYLLQRALGPAITGRIVDSLTRQPLEAEVQVLERISPDINPRLSRPDNGRYHRLLAPGTYTLRFIKDGYATKQIGNVVVSGQGPSTVDVELVPINPVPPAVDLINPANGQEIDSAHLSFVWHRALSASRYVMEIAADSSFAVLHEIDSTVTETTYQNNIAFTCGRYFWRVTACNANGCSPRSTVRLFDIMLSPAAPSLISPVGNSQYDTAFVEFLWHETIGANRYAIEVAVDSVFQQLILTESTIVDTSYWNAAPLADGRYFWRVTAFNNCGASSRSAVASFRISTSGISFVPGDVNADGVVMGSDVTYLVRYFKGIGPPPPLVVNGFYPAADANGDCVNRGSDITYLVNYFKGGPPPIDGRCF